MIRMCLAAVAALALAACSKAPEDVTARYTLGGGVGTVTVQAAANGDARVEAGQQKLVRKGGTEYLVLTDAKGSFAAKSSDFIAVMGDMMKEAGIKPMAMPPQVEYDLTKQGAETIAEIKGDVWKVAPKQPTPGAESFEAVITSDPAFANVGKALEMQTKLGAAQAEQIQGGQGNLEKRVGEMLGKGMVLRFADALKLDKVEKTPIDPKVFDLPAVLDKAALKARMTAARAAAGPPPAMAPSEGTPAQVQAPAPAPTPSAAPKTK